MCFRIATRNNIGCYFGINARGASIAWWVPRRADWVVWSIGKPYFG